MYGNVLVVAINQKTTKQRGLNMSLKFSDEELETYFKLQQEAEEYLNMLIRHKRVEQIQNDNFD